MKKLLAFCLPILLLVSCGKTDKQLTLIFENSPSNNRPIYYPDSDSFVQKENTVNRLSYFTSDRWIEEYMPKGVNDTLRITCSNSHVEFYHSYTSYYALLQVGDTVYVRYDNDGTPVYRSSISDELATLYNGDALIFGNLSIRYRGLCNNIDKTISDEDKINSREDRITTANSTLLDSLLIVYSQNLLIAETKIDSLINVNVLPLEYQQYYSYRLKSLALESELIRLSASTPVESFAVSQNIYSFFNDDYCDNISYWNTVGALVVPIVREGGVWTPPTIRLIGDRDMFDETAIFDRLDAFIDSVPPSTLNIMRYLSLMKINMDEYGYPLDIQQKYFDKYRRYTAEFLIPNYVSVDDTMDFPFRFFVFLLKFIACTGAFFYSYRLFLKDKVGFLAGRIYLLVALVFSIALPLLTLPVHIAELPDSALFWNSMLNTTLELMFYVYLFGCLYFFISFIWQFYSIRKMKKDSWRIPNDYYTLNILTDIAVRPFVFFRNIFFNWHDWWDTENKKYRDQLLAHEIAHIKLWHSLDNLLIMLSRILCWVNPLLPIYGKEMKRINEFAADRSVARLYGSESYINALKITDTNFMKMEGSLINNIEEEFAERISKIQAKPVTWRNNCRVLIVVPLVILLLLLFSSELFVNIGKLPNAYNLPW